MRKIIFILMLLGYVSLYSQTVTGKWKTIDDKTGKQKSIVEIFESGGKLFGKVIEIFDETKRHQKCEKCTDEDKNKSVLGLIVIKGLKKDDDEYNGGKIVDPESGNLYKCTIKLDGHDKLIVRGYMGISLLGRSQTWIRVK